MRFGRIAIDTSKHVSTLHGVDEQGCVALRRELKRSQVEDFLRKQNATDVVLGACGGSRHWALAAPAGPLISGMDAGGRSIIATTMRRWSGHWLIWPRRRKVFFFSNKNTFLGASVRGH